MKCPNCRREVSIKKNQTVDQCGAKLLATQI